MKTQVRIYHANSSHSLAYRFLHACATPPRRSSFSLLYYCLLSCESPPQNQMHYYCYCCCYYCFLDQYLHQKDGHHLDLIAILLLLLLLPPPHDLWLNADLQANDHHNSPIFSDNSHHLHFHYVPHHNPNPNHFHYSVRLLHPHPNISNPNSNYPKHCCSYYYNSSVLPLLLATPASNTLFPNAPWIA